MLEGKGKIWKATKNTLCHVIYIPADIVKDSQYPFKPKDRVRICLVPKEGKLIVTKEIC